MQIDEALRSIGLRPRAVQQTTHTLRTLGFEEAVDLQLLSPSGPEQTELMEELRAADASIADRAKIRLLLAREGHAGSNVIKSAAAKSASDVQPPHVQLPPRQLQEAVATKSVSADTLAIVFSVLVGAAGYLVQV
eukprot:SAG31_NODE_7118_length_1784_cov_1.503858_4_plen_135_part_01